MSNPFYLHVFPFHIPYPPNVIRYSAMKSHEKSPWIIPKQSGNYILIVGIITLYYVPTLSHEKSPQTIIPYDIRYL